MVLWQRQVGWVEKLSMFGLSGTGKHPQTPHIPLPQHGEGLLLSSATLQCQQL